MKAFIQSERGRIMYWLIGIITVLIFAFILIPPLFQIINRVEPIVLSLPFFIFIEMVLGLTLSCMLVLLYWVQQVRGEL